MSKIGILDPDGINLNPLNNQPYSDQYKIVAKKWRALPAYKHSNTIIDLIQENQVILIVSSTGSGKTVLLPKLALHSLNYSGHVIVTMPKQIIVKSAAEYSAITMDVQLGKEIGYQYRGDAKQTDDTKILYATDGTLVSQLIKDPLIKKYDIVIIDEAHERKIQIDFLLYLLKNAMRNRKDLKVIIMSATINVGLFEKYFSDYKFASFNLEGERIYPIKSIFTDVQVNEKNYMEIGYEIIKNIIERDELTPNTAHDILFFVPSVNDTQKICDMVNRDKLDLYCIEIYAGVHHDKQVIAQDKDKYKEFGKNRKLVMATNVAESSITIDGIKFVIDSGFEFLSSYDPKLRAKRLDKKLITVAQVRQRMGRAGRTEAGICYHLYSEQQYEKEMEKYPEPSIKTSNIFDECLRLLGMISNTEELIKTFGQFIDPPKKEFVASALTQLKELDLISTDGTLTNTGKIVIELGVEPNVGVALITGYKNMCYKEILGIFTLIEMCHGKLMDVFNKPPQYASSEIKNKFNNAFNYFKSSEGDHISLLKILHKYIKVRKNKQDERKWCNKYFLNYSILRETYDRMKNIGYRISEILRENKTENTENINEQSTVKRVMKSIEYGFRNQIAYSKNNMYTTPHCNEMWNISQDSYLKLLKSRPKKVVYHEIFVTSEHANLNICSKI